MALATSQKISRVLPGKPYGDGSDGSLTISSNTTQSPTDESCSGSSGSKSLTTAGSTLSNDDVILIHQSRGTGVGNWEINRVASGGGTTSITLVKDLANTYTDSGASQAQAIVIPMYTDITVNNTYTWSGKDWGGNVGGFLIAACNGDGIVNGALNHDGTDGSRGSVNSIQAGATGGGFRGGRGDGTTTPNTGYQGEGTGGARAGSTSANGNGGGGAYMDGANSAGGGGGGNGTSGGNGGASKGSGTDADTFTGGTGGSTAGSADLTTGGFGGGGGGNTHTNWGEGGGSGGGMMIFFAKSFDISNGSASLDGGNGSSVPGDGNVGGSGGAAGGSMLVMGETIDMGSSVITADGGAGGIDVGSGSDGGAGGDGRIAVHYGRSVTGTTSPTLNSTEDTSLINQTGIFIA